MEAIQKTLVDINAVSEQNVITIRGHRKKVQKQRKKFSQFVKLLNRDLRIIRAGMRCINLGGGIISRIRDPPRGPGGNWEAHKPYEGKGTEEDWINEQYRPFLDLASEPECGTDLPPLPPETLPEKKPEKTLPPAPNPVPWLFI